MVNYMSALMSGACILFLFLEHHPSGTQTGNHRREQHHERTTYHCHGSGLVGALVYTFSDTFWFSAVEGEVYAFSSLFTAVVFWLILKWEDVANQPHSDRWLILIAYLTGLSIGVHLLNLLCLPAIVLVYYYKKTRTPMQKGSLLALFAGIRSRNCFMVSCPVSLKSAAGSNCCQRMGLSSIPAIIVYIILLAASIIWGV